MAPLLWLMMKSYSLSPTVTGATPTLTFAITSAHVVKVHIPRIPSLMGFAHIMTAVRAPPCFLSTPCSLSYYRRQSSTPLVQWQLLQYTCTNTHHIIIFSTLRGIKDWVHQLLVKSLARFVRTFLVYMLWLSNMEHHKLPSSLNYSTKAPPPAWLLH